MRNSPSFLNVPHYETGDRCLSARLELRLPPVDAAMMHIPYSSHFVLLTCTEAHHSLTSGIHRRGSDYTINCSPFIIEPLVTAATMHIPTALILFLTLAFKAMITQG